MENGRVFLGRCGYAGIPKVCSFGSWCLSGTPVTLPKCSPTNSCSGGRDLGPEGTCGYKLWLWSRAVCPILPLPGHTAVCCFPRLQRPMLSSRERLWPGSWWVAPSARRGCISTPTAWSPKVKASDFCQQSWHCILYQHRAIDSCQILSCPGDTS